MSSGVRRSWWLFSGAFLLLGLLLVSQLSGGGNVIDWIVLVLAGVTAGAALWHRNEVAAREAVGRVEAESLARILRGLSRSVSPDAIVAAIVGDLVQGTGADHVAVVRRRPDGGVLEATLVTRRAGVPSTTIFLPLTDIEDPSTATTRLADRVGATFGLTNILAAPLRSEEGTVGAIVLSRREREAWPEPARRLLRAAASETAAAFSRANSYREAEVLASTDSLTGLPNRRYFEEYTELLARRRRADDAVAILMIDIDRFKRVNDTHGHAVGDEVLRAVARAILATVRADDVPARVGGEEFVVLLKNPPAEVPVQVGERVREAVRRLDLSPLGVKSISVSVGVASGLGHEEPIADVVARADKALLRAKRAGRDRVVAA
ncbi:MAG TPA: sensor domain-containing diguanylate cyclase [Candidatus Eisenbacteria bacterium]|nr:sensor domain-containing diguanylate cyclase [Candidatus Eisenbacteria bacterium]